ncbi:hypothetical protein CVT25_012014 [Psilocybe cyanescens]|uniref:Uncharacterized protein n=1 Tax=Psilocybe cyanescens TaxID=93625 RepID=A0A409VWE4_PSICY|nr:hypothetical protein CVT25_012014 [Psilocybe cyanescens]
MHSYPAASHVNPDAPSPLQPPRLPRSCVQSATPSPKPSSCGERDGGGTGESAVGGKGVSDYWAASAGQRQWESAVGSRCGGGGGGLAQLQDQAQVQAQGHGQRQARRRRMVVEVIRNTAVLFFSYVRVVLIDN